MLANNTRNASLWGRYVGTTVSTTNNVATSQFAANLGNPSISDSVVGRLTIELSKLSLAINSLLNGLSSINMTALTDVFSAFAVDTKTLADDLDTFRDSLLQFSSQTSSYFTIYTYLLVVYYASIMVITVLVIANGIVFHFSR